MTCHLGDFDEYALRRQLQDRETELARRALPAPGGRRASPWRSSSRATSSWCRPASSPASPWSSTRDPAGRPPAAEARPPRRAAPAGADRRAAGRPADDDRLPAARSRRWSGCGSRSRSTRVARSPAATWPPRCAPRPATWIPSATARPARAEPPTTPRSAACAGASAPTPATAATSARTTPAGPSATTACSATPSSSSSAVAGAHQHHRAHLRPGLRPAHRARLPRGDEVTATASAWPASTPNWTCWPPSACARASGKASTPPNSPPASRRWSTRPAGPTTRARPACPAARSPRTLDEMVRLWGQLDALETDHHLEFQREPDLGFALAGLPVGLGQGPGRGAPRRRHARRRLRPLVQAADRPARPDRDAAAD